MAINCIIVRQAGGQAWNPFFFDGTTDDGNIKDAAWWASLKQWVLYSSTVRQRKKMVGKVFKIKLNASILGSSAHFVRCIGYDCDGDKTLTFQTMNSFNSKIAFDDDSAIWNNSVTQSNIRVKCNDYYNAFPGKDSIKIVQKKYCSISDGTTNHEPDQIYEETVFLPSYAEMGLLGDSFTLPSSMTEFAVENTNNIPYQWYDSDDKRKKGTTIDDLEPEEHSELVFQKYWTRSRSANNQNWICTIERNGSGDYQEFLNESSNNGYGYMAPAFVIG